MPQVVPQQPGFGDEIRRGLAPLIQALQQNQQVKLQLEELKRRQFETQSQAQHREQLSAESKERQKRLQQELKDKIEDMEARNLAQPAILSVITGGQTAEEAQAKISDPRVLEHFNTGLQEASQAQVAVEQDKAKIQQAQFQTEALEGARNLLSGDAKLSDFKDPTVAQAAMLNQAGVLGFLQAQMELAAQQGQIDSQERMLARQAAMQTMKGVSSEFSDLLDNSGGFPLLQEAIKEGEFGEEITSIDQLYESILNRRAKAELGLEGAELRLVLGESIRKFGGLESPGARGALANLGVLSPGQRRVVEGRPGLKTAWAKMSESEQAAALEFAQAVATGQMPLSSVTVSSLDAAGAENPREMLRLINALSGEEARKAHPTVDVIEGAPGIGIGVAVDAVFNKLTTFLQSAEGSPLFLPPGTAR